MNRPPLDLTRLDALRDQSASIALGEWIADRPSGRPQDAHYRPGDHHHPVPQRAGRAGLADVSPHLSAECGMNAARAKHLAAVLKDPTLYASILKLDNQAINDLFVALDKAATVCRNTVYIRTHWMEEAQS